MLEAHDRVRTFAEERTRDILIAAMRTRLQGDEQGGDMDIGTAP
ncbi:MAG: hypothetical protein RH946_21110 [Rhodospirillales bacterium]